MPLKGVRLTPHYAFHAMSKRTVGIDIGSNQVKVVVAEEVQKGGKHVPKIIGTGFAESRGLRHGYIINGSDVRKSLESALTQAEGAIGDRIKGAYVAVGGVGLEEFRARGEATVSRADFEVTNLDLEKAAQEAERAIEKKLLNRKILHAIPLRYLLDGEEVLGRPQGLKGNKLSVDMLFITTLEQHLADLIAVIEDAGVSVIDVTPAPLAASFVTLTRAQKMTGCVLANIGAETLSLAVFENNTPISVKVFPMGSSDITNDIALGLKISLEDAEQLKRGTLLGTGFSQKRLDDIIQARLSAMLDLVEAHLESIGKSGLLPAGIVITGGGSGLATLEDLARNILKLPTRRAGTLAIEGARVRDGAWAVAYGLCIWGMSNEPDSPLKEGLRKVGAIILNVVRRFLP